MRAKVTKVEVYPVPVTGVTVAPKTATGTSGEAGSKQFSATVEPANATNKAVTWAVVDGDGDAVEGLTISTAGLASWTDAVTTGAYTVKVTTTDGAKTATASLTLKSNLRGGLASFPFGGDWLYLNMTKFRSDG